MKERRTIMKKKTVLLLLAILAIAAPAAFAILGLGDIVYDPSVYEEALQQFAQLEQQYTQLVQTYQVAQNQYQEMLRMAQHLPATLLNSYRTAATRWVLSAAADTYGNTAAWTSGLNTGTGVRNGYSAATETLGTYGAAFSNLPAKQAPGVKAAYATVELTDAANLSAMQTIGDLRGNAAAFETAIQNLENDSLSSDPNLNTELAVLNKINAAGVIQLRASQNANKLLVALAESKLIEAKRTRDAEARAFNQHISFMQNEQTELSAQAAGASEAMLAWRMP
jgi:hypothetical protein